jgi:nicotinamidase-related amidase
MTTTAEEDSMPADILDPQHSCLLFFDTSLLYVNGPTLDPKDRPPQVVTAVANWQRQLSLARELGMMVAYAHTAYRPDGADYFSRLNDRDIGGRPFPDKVGRVPMSRAVINTPAVAIPDEIAPRSEDFIFWKPRWNPFHQTTLELSLRLRGVDTIVVNGGSTEIGIAATAYAAQALDFDLVVVSDGCTSSQEDCQTLFMTNVFRRIGRVRTTDEVLTMLREGAATAGGK